MAIKRQLTRSWQAIAPALLLFAASGVYAAPGFIAASSVSGDEFVAEITIELACAVQYVDHSPAISGQRLRIHLQPTTVCIGVPPSAARSREQHRPLGADNAKLSEVFYEGASATDASLTLVFNEPVRYEVVSQGTTNDVIVRVHLGTAAKTAMATAAAVAPATGSRQVVRPKEETQDYAINLKSFQRIPTIADVPNLPVGTDQRIYYSEADIDGTTWYRLRLGDFESSREATITLAGLTTNFPDAWVGQVDPDGVAVVMATDNLSPEAFVPLAADLAPGDPKVDALMEEARKSMAAGQTSRAVQIYTKVLQMPANPRQQEAQEYLALAREKKGQMAHAKVEYQRYLSLYPDSEGAARVSQRLAALLANNRLVDETADAGVNTAVRRRPQSNDWRFQTFFSQYYRRDANQQNDQEEIISQSALYSNVNFDARRRGERFDFSSRVSAGYRSDFLKDSRVSGNPLRVSYAYADLADASTGLRGRVGRQSRNSGGVLGRFDGFNLGYQIGERVLLSTVVGKPAYSSNDSIDDSRSFYGASVNYGPILENLELGLFYIEQTNEGILDRQAVGAEFRYFGSNQSFWGMVDYDTSYNELSSAFLQGSWRFESRLSIHAVIDKRRSPFLTVGNAIIGQPVATFAELAVIFSEDELRQLSLDRSAESSTYSVGLAYPLTPKFQITVDTSHSEIEATPASGGVFGSPASSYSYYSGSLVASSLFKEGDVSIFSVRYSESSSSKVTSMTLDSRVPIGSTWRINPRLRVDRRELITSSTYEWIYTPGVRILYRPTRKWRIELDAGKQFAQRDVADINLDRESYYINLGYQVFF